MHESEETSPLVCLAECKLSVFCESTTIKPKQSKQHQQSMSSYDNRGGGGSYYGPSGGGNNGGGDRGRSGYGGGFYGEFVEVLMYPVAVCGNECLSLTLCFD